MSNYDFLFLKDKQLLPMTFFRKAESNRASAD